MTVENLYVANYYDLKQLNWPSKGLVNSFILSFLSFCQSSKKHLDITADKISHYTGFSQKIVNSHLNELHKEKLLVKNRHKSHRIKCSYRSTAAINFEKTIKINTITGSHAATILLTRILYGLNNTDIEINGIKYCVFNIQTLSHLIHRSRRTTYRIVKDLIDKTLLVRISSSTKRNAYYTISKETVEKLLIAIRPIVLKNETNIQNDTALEDYTIYIQDNCINNNNYTGSVNFLNKATGNDPPLSEQEINYIKGAIKKSLPANKKDKVDISLLTEEVVYSLKNLSKKNKKLSFINKLNILMKLIKMGRWGRPYGFEKHTEAGRQRWKEELGHVYELMANDPWHEEQGTKNIAKPQPKCFAQKLTDTINVQGIAKKIVKTWYNSIFNKQ